ncbi:MAG: Do family serine endopeptidase [Candidatus Adiutrix sp.]|jgi:serine protease Do|nr:Do family serine endopeptidase [Candidatus Adiutrix sp.]
MKIRLLPAALLLAAGLAAVTATAAEVATTKPALEPSPQPLTSLPSFAPIVEKAEAAVVFISVTKTAPAQRPMRAPVNSPTPDDFFERFFGRPPQDGRQMRERKSTGQGSGFIFDPEGYIITNNHVVEGAEEIKVKLSGGEEIAAEIIGLDPKTDLALIKLKKAGPYPYLNLGDSQKVKIGDWVVAIGNPFGLDHTVTAGILSARSRSIGAGPYDDFLQTDAAINLGNSGGPLLNLHGEVIGINTAIIAGGNNIGFAIPTGLAKGVVNQLKSKGRVVRGWMGVVIEEVKPALAKEFGLGEPRGALVREIDAKGPAVAAKLKPGDVILKFDDREVKQWQDLPLIVANTEVGKKVKVVVFRQGRESILDLTVAELKDTASEGAKAEAEDLGLTLTEITPELRSRHNLADQDGLFVAAIEADSPAAESDFQVADLIFEVNGRPVRNKADYREILKSKKAGEVLLFLVKRGERTIFLTITRP